VEKWMGKICLSETWFEEIIGLFTSKNILKKLGDPGCRIFTNLLFFFCKHIEKTL
jgi:hypothetical protein